MLRRSARLWRPVANAAAATAGTPTLALATTTTLTRTVRRHAASTAATSPPLPLRTGRPRLVVVGTGWGAASLLRRVDPRLYDLTVISERNHMVFTPLLSSVTVGTLSPSSVAVHIADIQPALRQGGDNPANAFVTATAVNVLPARRAVECVSADGLKFFVEYDRLVLAAGSQGSTFGVPGVTEHALPLRDVRHAEAIRARLIRSVALAGVPGRRSADAQRLLSLVIVGGGPTGVELAGEVATLVRRDLARVYPSRSRRFSIALVEARELLGTFDAGLRQYAAAQLTRRGVTLVRGTVRRVTQQGVELADGASLPAATVVWSTGVGPTPFTLALPFAKTPIGRLAVDGALRALQEPPGWDEEAEAAAGASSNTATTPPAEGDRPPAPPGATSIGFDEAELPRPSRWVPVPGVYALGDCCADVDAPLPALAQVAEQQGAWLARRLNEEVRPVGAGGGAGDVFAYRHFGSMATTGGLSAILQLDLPRRPGGKEGGPGAGADAGGRDGAGADAWLPRRLRFRGFFSWLAWRSAYATRLGSFRKRASVLFDWTQTMLFGRDLSQW